jgi:hypothetical protein
MNKTAIGIVFVVILTIIVLSYFLLSKCPDGKERKGFKCVDKESSTITSRSGLVGFATGCTIAAPFRNTLNNQCVASCPVGTIVDNSNCVIPRQIIPPLTPAQIAAGQKAGVTSYTQCPLSHPLKEYRSCVNACAPGLFIDISECVQSCPRSSTDPLNPLNTANKVLHNGRCLDRCPVGTFRDLSNGVIPICVSSCPTRRPRIDIDISRCQPCSTRIPSQVNNNGTCLASCPAETYRNDISMCVSINPLIRNNWSTSSIYPGSGTINSTDRVSDYENTRWAPFWDSGRDNFWISYNTNTNLNIKGFSLLFSKNNDYKHTPETDSNITVSIYKNITSYNPSSLPSESNKVFQETFVSSNNQKIAITRFFNPSFTASTILIHLNRLPYLYDFILST